MSNLHSASSKLLYANAPYNTLRGILTRLHLEVYKLFKGNFADARISFLIKARQEHRELRSLLVTENCAVSSYLRFCVCASGTFVFIVINLGVCAIALFTRVFRLQTRLFVSLFCLCRLRVLPENGLLFLSLVKSTHLVKAYKKTQEIVANYSF